MIPILVNIRANGGDALSYVIIIALTAYPILTYAFIKKNKERIKEEDEEFIARNEVVYG
jgi:hypothetical protein